jgi:hypothetical protein
MARKALSWIFDVFGVLAGQRRELGGRIARAGRRRGRPCRPNAAVQIAATEEASPTGAKAGSAAARAICCEAK